MPNYQERLDKYYSIKRNPYEYRKEKPSNETFLSKELAIALGCKWEYRVPYGLGRADCISREILIECKKEGCHEEKSALGQLILYAYSLKFKGDLAIGIIGKNGNVGPGALKFCQDFGILVFYYNIYTKKWKLIKSTDQPTNNKLREFYL